MGFLIKVIYNGWAEIFNGNTSNGMFHGIGDFSLTANDEQTLLVFGDCFVSELVNPENNFKIRFKNPNFFYDFNVEIDPDDKIYVMDDFDPKLTFTSEYTDNRIKIIRDSNESIAKQENKIEVKPTIDYLNSDHPTYSEELAAAIETWELVLKNNPPKPNRGSRKALIEKHLKTRYPHFSSEAVKRICGILNPDKSGGVPKSEINLPTP